MQLEEFEEAVRSSYIKSSSDDARDRHREFIVAIEDQISKILNSLKESALSEGETSLPRVRLDEGECNELALFLSGPSTSEEYNSLTSHYKNKENPEEMGEKSTHDSSKNSSHSVERGSLGLKEEKSHGHRRTASANADIGTWKIAIVEEVSVLNLSNGQALRPPQKIPSLSGIFGSMESAYKFNLPKNGVRKWKAVDGHQESDVAPLQSSRLTRGINSCYETVRVAWIVMMNVTISNFMVGMVPYKDNFNDHSIKCNIVNLCRQLSGLFFSFG